MDNISICVSFIAALLGIAYPILFEVVSRLDEKYSSQAIIDLFKNERENKLFVLCLKISLISLFLWMLKLHPLVERDGLNQIIGKSAELILIISTFSLIVSFFFFVRKVLIYYTPKEFARYSIEKHKRLNEKK